VVFKPFVICARVGFFDVSAGVDFLFVGSALIGLFLVPHIGYAMVLHDVRRRSNFCLCIFNVVQSLCACPYQHSNEKKV
jgi:hypothetical protein